MWASEPCSSGPSSSQVPWCPGRRRRRGYLADSLGKILVSDYALTVSVFTFVGEALLIVWLFELAIKGTRASESQHPVEMLVRASEALES